LLWEIQEKEETTFGMKNEELIDNGKGTEERINKYNQYPGCPLGRENMEKLWRCEVHIKDIHMLPQQCVFTPHTQH
jgi:hypothetical protein